MELLYVGLNGTNDLKCNVILIFDAIIAIKNALGYSQKVEKANQRAMYKYKYNIYKYDINIKNSFKQNNGK